ncbi:small lysine-rich protein 1 [Aulostomus maculatus]
MPDKTSDTIRSECSRHVVRFVFSSKPPKSRKSRSNSSKPAKKTGNTKKRSSSAKSIKTELDLLSPAAMENLYYISHNAGDCLAFRGFGWPRKKSKKRKKGKKQKRTK